MLTYISRIPPIRISLQRSMLETPPLSERQLLKEQEAAAGTGLQKIEKKIPKTDLQNLGETAEKDPLNLCIHILSRAGG